MTEGLVRLLLDPPGIMRAREEDIMFMNDSVRGYSLKPGANAQYTANGHHAKIHINERGFRGPPYREELQARIRVLTLGDSFTLGLGVDSTDPWPRQLETLLRIDLGTDVGVVNGGAPGYSARQMRQVAEQVLPELHPQIVIWGMNSETWWRVDSPYVFRAGQLVASAKLPGLGIGRNSLYFSTFSHPWVRRTDFWLNQHFQLGAHLLDLTGRAYAKLFVTPPPPQPIPPPVTDPAVARQRLDPALKELRRTAVLSRNSGASFVVLLINPQSEDGSFPPLQLLYNRVVSDYCLAAGVAVVDPVPALTKAAGGRSIMRFRDNYHWSALAHHIAAEELRKYLTHSMAGILNQPSPPGS